MKIKYISIFPIVAVFVFSGFSFANAQSDVFTQNLYYGLQNNSQVTQLQEFLTSQNLYSGPITGNFYFLTLGAVKAFQTQQGITPAAGYFGPVTMAAANKIADAAVSASNNEAVTETGTSTPPVIMASTTPQLQLEALLKAVVTLEQQLQSQQSSTQALQQIVQNTTPPVATTPAPVPTLTPVTPTNSPTVQIEADGSVGSLTIPSPTSVTFSWTSQNTNSCNITSMGSGIGISGNVGTSGNHLSPIIYASTTVTIQCEAVVNNVLTPNAVADSVTVNNSAPAPSFSISGSSVPQSVLISTPLQTFGTFTITLSSEPITVQTMNFTIVSTNPGANGDSINSYPAAVILAPNGNLVATASSSMNGSTFSNIANLTFSNVTLPISGTYKIVAAGSGGTGDTLTLSTNPSTNWSGVVGEQSGESVTLPNTAISLGTATFTGESYLAVNVNNGRVSPATNVTISPGNNITLGTVTLAATANGNLGSNGNILLSSIPLDLNLNYGAINDLRDCQLLNGASPLNSGANIVNPISGTNVFTLDQPLTLLYNDTVTALTITCNVASSTPNGATFAWGFNTSDPWSPTNAKYPVTLGSSEMYGQVFVVNNTAQ